MQEQETNVAEQPKKLGVAQLKALVVLGCQLGNLGDEMGHIGGTAKWAKLTELFPLGIKLTAIDFKAALAEAKDIDAAERVEIEEAIKSALDLQDDALEGVIEKAISVAELYAQAVTASIALGKEIKALKA